MCTASIFCGQQVVEALKPYGLTLQNYASIKEQQIGGFTQAGAHGTGAGIPPVDEQVKTLKLNDELSDIASSGPSLFPFCLIFLLSFSPTPSLSAFQVVRESEERDAFHKPCGDVQPLSIRLA